MRLAIVFDDLIQFGGAERLLLGVHEIWPDAPIYTPVASKRWKRICKEKNIKLISSYMDYLPFSERLNRFYALFLFHILTLESFDFSSFDVVLSISARFAHGIITKPSTRHICYMNSPGRWFWEADDYFENEKLGRLGKKALGFLLYHMRLWDFSAANRVDYFIANSKTPQQRIYKYYKRKSDIIYPFVEVLDYMDLQDSYNLGDYFLVISRLVSWKRVDIAVNACSKLKIPLKVVGEGPDSKRLRKLANSSVKFLGYVSEEKKKQLLQDCKAVINTQYEDFGLVPLEAMAFGKPVIAYGYGGVLETVLPGRTGEFFYSQTAESLIKVLKEFNPEKYSRFDCVDQAQKFSKEEFTKQIKSFVHSVYLDNI